ncbi:sensor histidine kinase [Variovorax ginsengisoli]|uniref:histidine kinase n=1 Tax=Variovorax ginsengisoli TaxID=363844 RepID=A0ABT9S6R4_9BURK|nr:ATP-binding protein [Variovorax ginsengisoli]MDP9899017.1 signal transduction histidine kinase [Variovorax ginsengisoli]
MLLLALLALVLLAAPQRLPSSVPAHFTSADTLIEDGDDFAPAPYLLDPDSLAGGWTPVALPHVMHRPALNPTRSAALNGATSVVNWYRLQIPPLARETAQRYIYIPRVKADGRVAVYGDSRLLYQSNSSLIWNGWNQPLRILLTEGRDAPMPAIIFIRIERPVWAQGALSTVWLGTDEAIGWRYRMRTLLQVQLPYMASVAFLAVGLFSLAVRIRLGKGSLYMVFFLITVAAYIRSIHYYVGQEKLILSDEWFLWLTVSSLFWLIGLSHFFSQRLHRQPRPLLSKVTIGVCGTLTVITLPDLMPTLGLPSIAGLTPIAYLLGIGLMPAIVYCGYVSARKVKSLDGVLVACWGALAFILGLFDLLLQNNFVGPEALYLGSYANNGLFLVFMYILFRRYVEAIDDVKRTNASLEARLQAREAELTTTHTRLREAERHQTLSRERQRLMQDMHDGLGSSLISAIRSMEQGGLSDVKVTQILKDCVDDLKLAIDSMEPVEADLLLLLATLRFRLEPRLEGTGIVLRWAVTQIPELKWLEPSYSLHILRIFQEAFANILKHTRASEIHVSTGAQDGWVSVTIADNGAGFDTALALRDGGKGLANQMRRAEALGGQVLIVSDAGGTRVTLRLPVERPARG